MATTHRGKRDTHELQPHGKQKHSSTGRKGLMRSQEDSSYSEGRGKTQSKVRKSRRIKKETTERGSRRGEKSAS